jgi:predicted HTH domain antitoxin
MSEAKIEIKFTIPLIEIPEEHILAAEHKAQEAFVMELLRQGDISAGRAARLLGLDRSQLSKLMYSYDISPFDDTIALEDLQKEVNSCIQMLENKCHQ